MSVFGILETVGSVSSNFGGWKHPTYKGKSVTEVCSVLIPQVEQEIQQDIETLRGKKLTKKERLYYKRTLGFVPAPTEVQVSINGRKVSSLPTLFPNKAWSVSSSSSSRFGCSCELTVTITFEDYNTDGSVKEAVKTYKLIIGFEFNGKPMDPKHIESVLYVLHTGRKPSRTSSLDDYITADFSTDFYGPNGSVLSTLPAYGESNANVPRGTDGYMRPYKELRATLDETTLKYYNLQRFVEGGWVTLYHGTVAHFNKFDMSYVREELVNSFYGKGIFFTPSKEIAWEYALANRNYGLPSSVIEEVSRQYPKAGAFMLLQHEVGYSASWDVLVSMGFDFALDTLDGLDPNNVSDVVPYIIGAQDPVIQEQTLFGSRLMVPDYIFETLEEWGIDTTPYKPKVYVCLCRASNVLVTNNMSEAKRAPKQGYDGVVYHGSQLVGGVPEVAIHNSKNIKILRVDT